MAMDFFNRNKEDKQMPTSRILLYCIAVAVVLILLGRFLG